MNCKYHKESEAKFICDKCKQPICEECSVDVNGNRICRSCIQKSVFSDSNRQSRKGGILESFVFFCFACVPGAGHMYMSLFKRGFQLMIGFIGAISLFSYINTESMIPLIIIPVWFFSFFDSYAIRRKLRAGEDVDDELIFEYEVMLELLQNRKIVGVVILFLGFLGVANAFEYSVIEDLLGGRLYWSIKRSIIPFALVVSGVYILQRSRKPEKAARPEDNDEDNIEA